MLTPAFDWTNRRLVVLCRIAQIGVIQLDTTPTGRILYSLCRAESGFRPCTEIGANGQLDKVLLVGRLHPARDRERGAVGGEPRGLRRPARVEVCVHPRLIEVVVLDVKVKSG